MSFFYKKINTFKIKKSKFIKTSKKHAERLYFRKVYFQNYYFWQNNKITLKNTLSSSDCNGIRTHNHLIRKRRPVWLNG